MSQIENQAESKIVIMTGATAGLGALALKQIAASSKRVIVGSRGTPVKYGEYLPLNLSSLASVRAFAAEVIKSLKSELIDVLVLNAGIGGDNTKQHTEDEFEITFAVNHLAHYLLARLLLPHMANKGRLIITTSDVHAQAPKTLDIASWSVSQAGDSPMKAYAASKLCNLLTARSLTSLDIIKEKQCQVIAYNPGLTIGTSLARNAPKWQQSLMSNSLIHGLLGLFSHFIPMMYPGKPERAGEALAELTLNKATPPKGKVYASLVRGIITYPAPSDLASSNQARDSLWQESEKMVGWQSNKA